MGESVKYGLFLNKAMNKGEIIVGEGKLNNTKLSPKQVFVLYYVLKWNTRWKTLGAVVQSPLGVSTSAIRMSDSILASSLPIQLSCWCALWEAAAHGPYPYGGLNGVCGCRLQLGPVLAVAGIGTVNWWTQDSFSLHFSNKIKYTF